MPIGDTISDYTLDEPEHLLGRPTSRAMGPKGKDRWAQSRLPRVFPQRRPPAKSRAADRADLFDVDESVRPLDSGADQKELALESNHCSWSRAGRLTMP